MKVEMHALKLGLIPDLEEQFDNAQDDIKRAFAEPGRYAQNKGVVTAEINIKVVFNFAPDTGVAVMETTCTPKLPKLAGGKRVLNLRGGDFLIEEDDNSEQVAMQFTKPQVVE
jgi:hypothetical protein